MVALQRNPGNYRIATAKLNDESASVVCSIQGAIPQIKYEGERDDILLQTILGVVSQEYGTLRIPNVPSSEADLIAWLSKNGFEVSLEQYEMCIDLRREKPQSGCTQAVIKDHFHSAQRNH